MLISSQLIMIETLRLSKNDDEDTGPVELLERPKEYIVRFRFPEVSSLQPPILGLFNVSFGYEGQGKLFKNVDFGEKFCSFRM